jgi:hypothetical protein
VLDRRRLCIARKPLENGLADGLEAVGLCIVPLESIVSLTQDRPSVADRYTAVLDPVQQPDDIRVD